MPAEPALKELAAANSIAAPGGMKDLLDNEKFHDIVLKEVQAAGRKGGLVGIELVSGVVLVHEEWTPRNVSQMHYTLKFPCQKNADLVAAL
jgi:long-chain acyl-CoA synthetase